MPLALPPRGAFALTVLALVGCASTQPLPYAQLGSASQLRPNAEDDDGRVPYRLGGHPAWGSYVKVLIEPVVLYEGQDHQFEDVPPAERARLAESMQVRFTKKLRTRFEVVSEPGPHTLRLRLTLTGAKATRPVLSTFTRFDLVGMPYNVVQGIRGKEGSFTGSVSYAVEIFDAQTRALLDAFVAKQYPNALNLRAGLGAMDAARIGLDKGADELVAQFD